jgi:hypothetical protein
MFGKKKAEEDKGEKKEAETELAESKNQES